MTPARPAGKLGAESLWLFAGFFVGAALVHAAFIGGGFFEYGDNSLRALPYKVFVGDALQRGELPLWNPLTGIGLPAAGVAHYGLYYPANLLFVWLRPLVAQALYVLLHIALAGMFATLYLRRLGLGFPARIFGGIAYAFCGPLLTYLGSLTMLAAFPWLPAAALGLEQLRRTRRWSGAAWSGLALGLAILAGDPPLAIDIWVTIVLYGIILAALSRDRMLVAGLGLAAAIGGGLAAVLLIPAARLAPPIAGATTAADGGGPFRPDLLLDFLFPHLGSAEAYLGLLPLALLGYAIVRRRRLSAAVRAWLFVAGISLILMLGHFGPLWDVMRHIPIIGQARHAVYHDISLALAVAVVAAAAIQQLAEASEHEVHAQRAWLRKHGLALVFVLLFVGGVLSQLGVVADEVARRQPRDTDQPLRVEARVGEGRKAARPPWQAFGVIVLSVGALALLVRDRRRGRWLIAPVLLLDLATVSVHLRQARQRSPEVITDNVLAAAIEGDHERSDPPRVVIQPSEPTTTLQGALPFAFGIGALGLPDTTGRPPRATASGDDKTLADLVRGNRLLSLLGARYIVASTAFWRALPPLVGVRALPPDSLVAEIARDKPPDEQVSVRVGKRGLVLEAAGGEARLHRRVETTAHRTYEIAVSAAVDRPVGEPLVAGLYAPGSDRPAAPLLVVKPEHLARRFRDYARSVSLGQSAGPLVLRVSSASSKPVVVRSVTLRQKPLPLLRDGASDDDEASGKPEELYTLIARHETTEVRRNRAALPPFWLAREVIPVASAHDALESVRGKLDLDDMVKTALVEGIERPRRFKGGSADRVERSAGLQVFKIDSDGPGLLVVNATHDPAWRVTVDGRPARPLRAYGLLRAVEVPSGPSVVRMRYRPAGLSAGLWISVASLLLALGIALGPLRRRWSLRQLLQRLSRPRLRELLLRRGGPPADRSRRPPEPEPAPMPAAPDLRSRWLRVAEGVVTAVVIATASLAVVLRVAPEQLYNSDITWIELLYRDLVIRGWPLEGWRLTPAPYLVPDLPLFFAVRSLVADFRLALLLSSAAQVSLLLGTTIWMLKAVTRARALTLALLLGAAIVVLEGPSLLGLSAVNFLYTGYYHSGALILGLASVGCLARWRASGRYRWLVASCAIVFAAAASDGISVVFPLGTSMAVVLWGVIRRRIALRQGLLFAVSHGVAWALGPLVLHLSPLGEAIPPSPLAKELFNAGFERWERTFHHFFFFVPRYFASAHGVLYLAVMIAGLAAAIRALRRKVPKPAGAEWFLLWIVLAGTVLPAVAVQAGGMFFDMTQVNYLLPLLWLPIASAALHLAPRIEQLELRPDGQRRLPYVLWAALSVMVLSTGLIVYGWTRPDSVVRYRPPIVDCLDAAIEQANVGSEELPVGFGAYWTAKKVMVFSNEDRFVIQFAPYGLEPFVWITNRRWFDPPVETKDTSSFVVVDYLEADKIRDQLGEPDGWVACKPPEMRWGDYFMVQPTLDWEPPSRESGVLIYNRTWREVAEHLYRRDDKLSDDDRLFKRDELPPP